MFETYRFEHKFVVLWELLHVPNRFAPEKQDTRWDHNIESDYGSDVVYDNKVDSCSLIVSALSGCMRYWNPTGVYQPIDEC